MFVEETGVAGKSLTVKLVLYNEGTRCGQRGAARRNPARRAGSSLTRLPRSPAYAVEVQDAPWQGPAGERIKTLGEPSARFATIQPQANETLSYAVVPQAAGVLFGSPARVSYRSSVGAVEPQLGHSTGVQMEVISRGESLVQQALWAGTFLTLGLLQSKVAWANTAVLALVLGVLAGAGSLHAQYKLTHKRRKQMKAEAELMKSE